MSIKRGLVRSIEARSDGWIEVVLVAVHSGNIADTLFIENLDGDLTEVHRRLAKLALLRDALAQTLPVEVDVRRSDDQGDLIEDVTILRSRSIEGRRGDWWVSGHVIGLTVRERGPESSASPYTDIADEAYAALLADDGSVVSYRLDLQRRYEATGHALLDMLAEARRTRRPLRLHVQARLDDAKDQGGVIVGAEWKALEAAYLEEDIAFIERLGQRGESLDTEDATQVDRVTVKYTTAPDQYPEGDISENGSFVPQAKEAWVHQDSVLLPRLVAALRDGLQVKLGRLDDEIHAVEVISQLGSAARPIWITFGGGTLCEEQDDLCLNEPTVRSPSGGVLDSIPRTVSWRGKAYFNKGIWRFVVQGTEPIELRIDNEVPCAEPMPGEAVETGWSEAASGHGFVDARPMKAGYGKAERRESQGLMAHAFLEGLHDIEFIVRGKTCGSPFRAHVYRIR